MLYVWIMESIGLWGESGVLDLVLIVSILHVSFYRVEDFEGESEYKSISEYLFLVHSWLHRVWDFEGESGLELLSTILIL
jgi:hypothetical protein